MGQEDGGDLGKMRRDMTYWIDISTKRQDTLARWERMGTYVVCVGLLVMVVSWVSSDVGGVAERVIYAPMCVAMSKCQMPVTRDIADTFAEAVTVCLEHRTYTNPFLMRKDMRS